MADSDVAKMKVADLKRELKLRGLTTTGNKNELQERLQTALIDGELTLEDTAISEGLLDDDDVLTDEEKSALDLVQEEAVLTSPPIEEEKDSNANTAQTKKIVLKRNISHNFPALTESNSSADTTKGSDTPNKVVKLDVAEASDEVKPSEDDKVYTENKKVVKLSQLSLKDRLEMRAKKFGVQAPAQKSKEARALRFGEVKATNTATSNETPTTSIDVLKKRAERFGCSVSSRMTELEMKEKLIKRQERFGTAGKKLNQNTTKSETDTSPDYAERAKQRLERFKTAVK